MPEKKNIPKADTAEIAKTGLAKLSDDERAKIQKTLKTAVLERDLPTFQAALLKLGFDDTSIGYEQMMKLWDEHCLASRHD